MNDRYLSPRIATTFVDKLQKEKSLANFESRLRQRMAAPCGC